MCDEDHSRLLCARSLTRAAIKRTTRERRARKHTPATTIFGELINRVTGLSTGVASPSPTRGSAQGRPLKVPLPFRVKSDVARVRACARAGRCETFRDATTTD